MRSGVCGGVNSPIKRLQDFLYYSQNSIRPSFASSNTEPFFINSPPVPFSKLMTRVLLNGDPRFVEALMSIHNFQKRYLSIDRLQNLYASIFHEKAFQRVVGSFQSFPASTGTGAPDPIQEEAYEEYPSALRLWHINWMMKKLLGRFHSTFYEETTSVRWGVNFDIPIYVFCTGNANKSTKFSYLYIYILTYHRRTLRKPLESPIAIKHTNSCDNPAHCTAY